MYRVNDSLSLLAKRRLDAIAPSTRNITLKKHFFFSLKPLEHQRALGVISTAELTPRVVLAEENRAACVERLKQRRPTKESQERVNEAAVLVPLCTYKGELGLLYTLRSTNLKTSRGQVSFPGGMRDKSDENLRETALRETWEELAISKDRVDVWADAKPVGRKHVSVLPVLGYIGELDLQELRLNPQEVEDTFVLSLERLCDPTFYRFTQFRDSYTLPTYLGGKYRVWGLTALITHMIVSALVPGVYKHKLTYLRSIQTSREGSLARENTEVPS